MIREEEIKYASKDYVNYLLDKQEYHNENYTEDDIRQAFEEGAKWADKTMLEKACNCTECIIFPSKEQRDWSKFTAPWYKNKKFNPNTLKPFDKVLVRDDASHTWKCNLFSNIIKDGSYPYKCVGNAYTYCIPYNNNTKHLVGTNEEAPEYYRYWEN